MPRRLIIGILLLLILGIVGGTGVFLWQRIFGGSSEPAVVSDEPSGSDGGLNTSELRTDVLVNAGGDDDNDGLTNAQEALWGTDPNNPDTDGDGFKDGEEVTANHNPTIAGPNDALPDNFRPQQDLQPLDVAPLQTDQFFSDNVDLDGSDQNLSEAYKSQFAENERNPDTLNRFINEQEIVTQLPTVRESSLTIAEQSGQATLNQYLEVVDNLGPLQDRDQLSLGLSDLYEQGDNTVMLALRREVQLLQQTLSETTVPPEGVELHKLLLGYTELVAATINQIAGWNEDSVKAMVALRQLGAIDQQYFPLIKREQSRLQGG